MKQATTGDADMKYKILGKSGLKVSELCLGAMTFGENWGWGSPPDTAKQIFCKFVEAGGNFVDTADGYTNGCSEELLGSFIKEQNLRDEIVLATKFTFNQKPGNPNAGGNGRKNVMRALEGSLKRLQTDYVDLYWLHAWDRMTPAEEVLTTMNDLVGSGKVRYFGLSDVPAWYLAKMQTLASQHARQGAIALQLEYSLVERSIEYEFIDAAREFAVGITPWSPLASGLLSGKYKKDDFGSEGRLARIDRNANPSFAKLFSERNWEIARTVAEIASQINRSPAQVALNWVINQPGITSTIIGATKLHQLEDNLQAPDFQLSGEHRARLQEVSRPADIHPYLFFGKSIQTMITGGVEIQAWHEQ
jgi:aryl-alcohol dehydrogenase-like predicted oxidoreductase